MSSSGCSFQWQTVDAKGENDEEQEEGEEKEVNEDVVLLPGMALGCSLDFSAWATPRVFLLFFQFFFFLVRDFLFLLTL